MTPEELIERYKELFNIKTFYTSRPYRSWKGSAACKSSFEFIACHQLTTDAQVKRFADGDLEFVYFDFEAEKALPAFYPLTSWDHDDNCTLIYVTSLRLLDLPREQMKADAAEADAYTHGCAFKLLTELELFGDNPEYMISIIPFLIGNHVNTPD